MFFESPTMSRMNTAERVRADPPVLREHETGLTTCRATAVLPDEPLAVLGDGTHLAVVDLTTGEVRRHEFVDEWGPKAIAGLAGRRVLVAGINTVYLYAIRDDRLDPLATWSIRSVGSIIDVAATPSGSVFAVAAGDRVYRGRVDRSQLDTRGSTDCLAVAVSADGTRVGSGHGGRVDLGPRVEVTVNDKDIPILSAGLSPDGRRLVACDDITQTVLADLDAGTTTEVLSAGKAIAARWSPDGSVCALISLTRHIQLLDRDGAGAGSLSPAEAGTYYLLGGGWTADGRTLVAGTEHGKILTWSW